MIEEKTREPQQEAPSAPQRPSTGKEKLRSLWARLECVGVLRRHRIRNGAKRGMGRALRLLVSNPFLHKLGGMLYAPGFAGEYTTVRIGRAIRAAAFWTGRRGRDWACGWPEASPGPTAGPSSFSSGRTGALRR